MNTELDSVLEFLNDNRTYHRKENITKLHHAEMLLNKLVKDGYVHIRPHKNYQSIFEYSITVDGINFLQKGGYSTKEETYFDNDLTSPRTQKASPNNSHAKVTKSPILERMSWIAGIIALLIAIYELVKQLL